MRYALGRRVYWNDGNSHHGVIVATAMAEVYSDAIPHASAATPDAKIHPDNPLLCIAIDGGGRRIIDAAAVELQPVGGPLREAALIANRDPFAGK